MYKIFILFVKITNTIIQQAIIIAYLTLFYKNQYLKQKK